MLKKPYGYDEAQAVKIGESQIIEPGWYPATILKVAQGSTLNGAEYLEFSIDIIDGQFARYYERDYKAQSPVLGEKKWRGVVRYFMTEKSLGMLKGGITAIEESNPGYRFDWNETTVKGKKIGVGIRREQYEATDGQLKFVTRPYAFIDIKRVIAGDMEPPKDRLLNNITAPSRPTGNTPPGYQTPAPTYANTTYNPYAATAETAPKFEELGTDEELPF